tara:strand:+ start:121 stop:324 length:204 start_codon:yes stop_codon:yes gene_type:complete
MHGYAGLFEWATGIFYANSPSAHQATYPKGRSVERILLGAVGRSAYLIYAAPHQVERPRMEVCRRVG